MDPKILKLIAKGAVAIIGSILIGTMVKMEKKVSDRIDEHFENKNALDEPTV